MDACTVVIRYGLTANLQRKDEGRLRKLRQERWVRMNYARQEGRIWNFVEKQDTGDGLRYQALRVIRSCSKANAVSAAALWRSSLLIRLERCFSTVLTLMQSRSAISLF